MKMGWMRWLAWGALGLYVALASSGIYLQAAAGVSFGDMGMPIPVLLAFYGLLGLLVAIGALIVTRHPQHPVGWILCLGLTTPSLDQFAAGYTGYDLATGHSALPAVGAAMVWLNWSGMPLGMLAFGLIFLLTPNGRFHSRGWARVAWTASASLATYLAAKTVEPGPLVVFPLLNNPYAVGARAWALVAPLMWAALGLLSASIAAATASLVLRMRQGSAEVRRQVRWLIPPGAIFLAGLPLVLLGEHGPDRTLFALGASLHMLAVAGLVLAVAFGVFRYRLYGLDILIRRTLVYSTLTGLLATVYFASVVVLQQVFTAKSQVTVVLSTLAIAALFAPLRRRIQIAIDKRFYRRKYDAALILARFAGEMRDQVDLDRLAGCLTAAVDEALQPNGVSLWLRRPGR
jgi:hypothetical protein